MKKNLQFAGFVLTGVVVGVGISLVSVLALNTFGDKRKSSTANSFSRILDSLEKSNPEEIDEIGTTEFERTSKSLRSLDDLDRYKKGFARDVALHIMLTEADEELLLKLQKQSEQITHTSIRHATQTAIARKLASIDPQKAILKIAKIPKRDQETFAMGIFREWSSMDLESMVEHTKEMSNPMRRIALTAIFESRPDLGENQKLSIGRQLRKERLTIELLTKESVVTLISEPQAAWNYVINDGQPDFRQQEILTWIAEIWIEKEGIQVLAEISSSSSEFDQHYWMRSMVGKLIESNPLDAFNSVSAIKSHLERVSLQELLLELWGNNNPHDLLQNLDKLPDNRRHFAEQRAIRALARLEPAIAATMLSKVVGESNKRAMSVTLAIYWFEQDADAAIEWILNESEVQKFRYDMLRQCLPKLALTDPDRALQIASQQPVSHRSVPLEAWIVSTLAGSNVDQAIDLLPQLKEETRYMAIQSIATAILNWHDPSEAIELANQLPEEQRNSLYNHVAGEWARTRPQELLGGSFDRLPTAMSKSNAAFMLLSYTDRQQGLTVEQREYARSYLSEDDSKRLAKFLEEEKVILGRYVSPYLD